MKVFVKGQGEVNLTQQHFVATGGQASVYIRQGTAYKIYTDPKDTIPEAKFRILSAIQDDHVIKPLSLLLDGKKHPVGYTMRAIVDSYSLGQLFTKSFRDRTNITNDDIILLAAKLKEHIDNIHKQAILIVDLNENNVRVPTALGDVYMIDTDSFQTNGYPATVIMPSVRDYSVKASNFSPLSDWFSYGVLAFQLFIGSHPYRGTHAGSSSVPKDQLLEHRMRRHISAFRPDVHLPKCCYPFDVIPGGFRDWLKAVLDEGKRLPPPDPRGGPAPVIVTKVAPIILTSGALTISEVTDFDGWTLLQYVESGANSIALVTKGGEVDILYNGRTVFGGPLPGKTLVGLTPKYDWPIALNLHQGVLTFYDFMHRTHEVLGMSATGLNRSGGSLYLQNASTIAEIDLYELPSKVIPTASHVVVNVLEHATVFFEGGALQNMVGSVFVSLFPKPKHGYQVRIPELDPYKILEAKFDGGVLMVVGSQKGVYDRLIFRFDEAYATYDLRIVSDISPTGLNFITLASGVCVSVTEDEKIEAFSARKGASTIKVVEDPAIGNDLKLVKLLGKAGFERGGKLCALGLK